MTSEAILKRLDEILEVELSGVARYLHYSFMIRGPSRIPIVDFFRKEALEALDHATQIGEKITALGGHPSIKIQAVPETNQHGIGDILAESLEFEKHALNLYLQVLPLCNENIALEEMVRQLIRAEQEHIEAVSKLMG